jgi:D-alanyl-D-alanine carboxypeptidase/D-alanyl-D-alanine-endopeptidase (penicillin-binding protein 4)
MPVRRLAILAGGLAAITLAAPAEAAILDDGGMTPVARPGSNLAARSSLSRSQLRRKLEREMDRVGGRSGAWVFDVAANGGGDVLYADSGRRRRMLASNSKLFTTAAFLDRFGADGTLATRVWERGQRAGVNDQILRGGLVLVGDGDPALAAPGFARRKSLPLTRLKPLARAVREAGIKRVNGDLLVDPTVFDGKRSVPQPGITGGPWLSTLSGLSFNAGFDGGRYAASPARDAGADFLKRLDRAGVKVKGRIRVGGAPPAVLAANPIDSVRSPTAAQLITQTNVPSDNFYAEMLLKRLAARDTQTGTTARGARKAERFASSVGGGASLVNGSGLGRTNKASPKETGRLLAHMASDDELGKPFRLSLPVAGRTGTLANRMRGTAAQGKCMAKTGTIDGVSALSGYCKSGNGLTAFSLLMNGVNLDAARRAQDAMAASIARFR